MCIILFVLALPTIFMIGAVIWWYIETLYEDYYDRWEDRWTD